MGVTVRDILRLALPPETNVIAGTSGITHPVTWVVMMRTKLPAFVDLRGGGEIALVSVEALHALDSRLTLATLVRRLAQAPVAAVAVIGEVTDEDKEAADLVRLPLLHLPDNTDLREIEREIARLISDYEAQLERRGAQLYNLLTKLSMSEPVLETGMMVVLETISERTGQCVACYAANGEMRVQLGQGSGRVALKSLRPQSCGDSSLLNQHIWVEAIGSPEQASGYLAIAGSSLDEWDRLAAFQGAAALSLVFAKEYAVQAAEERLRGDFLSMIIAGPPADPATIIQRGEQLGYDLTLPHIALLFSVEKASSTTQGRLMSSIQSDLNRRNIAAPLLRREHAVLCMLPLNDGLQPHELAESMRERLSRDYEDLTLALGTPAPSLMDWTRTLKESEQALSLGRQLFGSQHVQSFSDLGVYRLLVLLRDEPEMWTFYRETLSKLVSYDRKQDSELLKTLEEYFNHLGNLRATSEALHVHRNTLLYRLERIQQITGANLSDAEEHFSMWLALRAHRVLTSIGEAEEMEHTA